MWHGKTYYQEQNLLDDDRNRNNQKAMALSNGNRNSDVGSRSNHER